MYSIKKICVGRQEEYRCDINIHFVIPSNFYNILFDIDIYILMIYSKISYMFEYRSLV